jgi:hypothetical protein
MSMAMEDDLNLEGKADKRLELQPGETKSISLYLRVEEMKPFKAAWKTLFRKDQTSFESTFSFTVRSQNKVVDRCKFVMKKEGFLGELKN